MIYIGIQYATSADGARDDSKAGVLTIKVITCYQMIMSFNLPALSDGDPFMP